MVVNEQVQICFRIKSIQNKINKSKKNVFHCVIEHDSHNSFHHSTDRSLSLFIKKQNDVCKRFAIKILNKI